MFCFSAFFLSKVVSCFFDPMTTHRKIKTNNPAATHNSVSVAGMGAFGMPLGGARALALPPSVLAAYSGAARHAALLAQLPPEGQAAAARTQGATQPPRGHLLPTPAAATPTGHRARLTTMRQPSQSAGGAWPTQLQQLLLPLPCFHFSPK